MPLHQNRSAFKNVIIFGDLRNVNIKGSEACVVICRVARKLKSERLNFKTLKDFAYQINSNAHTKLFFYISHLSYGRAFGDLYMYYEKDATRSF